MTYITGGSRNSRIVFETTERTLSAFSISAVIFPRSSLKSMSLKYQLSTFFMTGVSPVSVLLGVDKVYRHILMSEVTLVRIALFGGAALNGTFSDDLSAVEESPRLFVIELCGGYLFKVTELIKPSYQSVGDLFMYLCRSSETGCTEDIKAYIVILQGLFLRIVIFLYKIGDSPLISAFAEFSVCFGDRGAVAVGAGYEYDIILADPVTQKARIHRRIRIRRPHDRSGAPCCRRAYLR